MNVLHPIVELMFKMDNFEMDELHVQHFTNGSSIDFSIGDRSDRHTLGVLVPVLSHC